MKTKKLAEITDCTLCPHYMRNTGKCERVKGMIYMPDRGIYDKCPLPDVNSLDKLFNQWYNKQKVLLMWKLVKTCK